MTPDEARQLVIKDIDYAGYRGSPNSSDIAFSRQSTSFWTILTIFALPPAYLLVHGRKERHV